MRFRLSVGVTTVEGIRGDIQVADNDILVITMRE